jgi:hypothetical protein
MASQLEPCSSEIRVQTWNRRAAATGRACSEQSLGTATPCPHDFPSTSPPTRQTYHFNTIRSIRRRLDRFPDGASFFRASAGTNLAERNGLAFVRLPAYRPDLDPFEACWRQRDSALGNRYVESINALTARINGTPHQLSLPEVCSFF